ncbi:NADAR family protein [Clostridium sp. C105KSO13]|uniref:NADAR family protein n=1 Tax=Clostridium sp. C105KSO13 TaxID=1776045 RepID=UPI0007405F3C|nr:NADAR family protein [Clostridium sp. C105KSO13]CUX25323.1 Swarming motility protein YbiA [Clostridium sp. C105KSO13]
MLYTNTVKFYTYSQIAEFRGNYAFLSNFYHAPIIYRGHKYANNEAAFQAQKTVFVREQQQFYMPRLTEPALAKRLGRSVTLRPDWNQVKIPIMYEVCFAKFLQHPELMQALLATGDTLLIEGNTWGDRFWGCVDGFGENHLGNILMDIRGKLNAELR